MVWTRSGAMSRCSAPRCDEWRRRGEIAQAVLAVATKLTFTTGAVVPVDGGRPLFWLPATSFKHANSRHLPGMRSAEWMKTPQAHLDRSPPRSKVAMPTC